MAAGSAGHRPSELPDDDRAVRGRGGVAADGGRQAFYDAAGVA